MEGKTVPYRHLSWQTDYILYESDWISNFEMYSPVLCLLMY